MQGVSVAVQARLRLVVGLVVALLFGIGASIRIAPELGVLVGWLAGASAFDLLTWLQLRRLDAAGTRAHAKADDPGRRITDLIVLVCSIASLGAVGVLLLERPKDPHVEAAHALLAVVSVAVAWITVHLIYAVRYARLYYSAPDGGIDFNQSESPEYVDFAYFSFTLGVSFAVSDTNVGKPAIRRVALQHLLLSYLLGTVVIGAMINLLVTL